jgi:hypothetical protein
LNPSQASQGVIKVNSVLLYSVSFLAYIIVFFSAFLFFFYSFSSSFIIVLVTVLVPKLLLQMAQWVPAEVVGGDSIFTAHKNISLEHCS